jgi:hypothetical protein
MKICQYTCTLHIYATYSFIYIFVIVCKYLATELKDRLEETGKTKEVLEIGHGLDSKKKKKIKYNTA